MSEELHSLLRDIRSISGNTHTYLEGSCRPCESGRLEGTTDSSRERATNDASPLHQEEASFSGESQTASDRKQHTSDEGMNIKSTIPRTDSTPPKYDNYSCLFALWWLEILACACSHAALFALSGTLYSYESRPSPDWPKWLTLNTIVSIFVVIIKGGVILVLTEGIGQLKWSWFSKANRPLEHIQMWDNATRGPFGASVLLGRLAGRDLLASLGALMVVLSLAVDPFAQQIIRYKDCAVTIPGSATLPRANSFGGDGLRIGQLSQSISPGEQKAINAGMLNPSPHTWFDCPSGNCTWLAEYSTTAWCSSCQDISDQLIVTNTSYSHKVVGYNNYTNTSSSNTYVGYILETSVAGGISVNTSTTGPVDQPSVQWEYAAMGPTANAILARSEPASFDYIIGAKPVECDDTYIAAHWPCNGPAGTRCSFFPCVKTFTATATTGRLTETLIDTATDWGFSPSGGAIVDLKCLNPSELESLNELGYAIEDDQRYLAYNITAAIDPAEINNTFPTSMILHNCLYQTSYGWLSSMGDHLRNQLNGTVMG